MAAPDLFNCKVNHLMTSVCYRIIEVRLSNFHLTKVKYANDTTLFINLAADIKAGLNILQEEALFGLHVSWEKIKLLHAGNGTDMPSITMESTTINSMDSFNYLRSLILSIGDLTREVNWCCGLTTAIMQSL